MFVSFIGASPKTRKSSYYAGYAEHVLNNQSNTALDLKAYHKVFAFSQEFALIEMKLELFYVMNDAMADIIRQLYNEHILFRCDDGQNFLIINHQEHSEHIVPSLFHIGKASEASAEEYKNAFLEWGVEGETSDVIVTKTVFSVLTNAVTGEETIEQLVNFLTTHDSDENSVRMISANIIHPTVESF